MIEVATSPVSGAARAESGNLLSRSLRLATTAAEVISGVAILGLMLLVVADVSLRLLAGSPIRGTIDYVAFLLMPAVVALGFAVAERTGDHIGNPTLLNRLGRHDRRNVLRLGGVLVLVFLGLQVWTTWWRAIDSLQSAEFSPGGLSLPLWPGRFLIPIGLALFALEVVRRFVRDERRRTAESMEPKDMGVKEWD